MVDVQQVIESKNNLYLIFVILVSFWIIQFS
jgi:hypothetical protein